MAEQTAILSVAERPSTVRRALPPTANCWRSLSSEDQAMLNKLLSEDAQYVEHDQLRQPGIEATLFGSVAELDGTISTAFTKPVPRISYPNTAAGRVPSLRSEDEFLLFLRYNYARKMVADVIESHLDRRLSATATRTLLAWAKRAQEIRGMIVTVNIPLVLAMAKRARFTSVDFNEMVSEGNMALLRSVEKFDCGRGFKFSTYSCRAILKSFSRVVMRATRYRGQFPVEFDPSIERSDFAERRRDDIEFDCVEELKGILLQNLADLSSVEQTVIRERFALVPPAVELTSAQPAGQPKTLEEVGVLIGVTKERVRQIQNKALRKIRQALEQVYLAA